MGRLRLGRALISVYDKTGLADLARGLAAEGIQMVSTGSTAKAIAEAGCPVTLVGDVTGFPECLDGRVKTLHPLIHGGLLADLRRESHRDELLALGIDPFELVIVNLYPFSQTVVTGASDEECVEQIDIGGPAMIRAGAKNYANVAVVVSPHNYGLVLQGIAAGGFTLAQRAELATEAFAHTATYDISVATWLGQKVAAGDDGGEFPQWIGASWRRSEVLRYGENPHQRSAVYVANGEEPGVATAEQLQGKPMSYNNYVDADAARRAVYDQPGPAVAIVKHANPCGIAVGDDVADAYRLALATDPVSAFGSVVASNRTVTGALAVAMIEIFTEVIVAPAFHPEALDIFATKANLRVLRVSGPLTQQPAEARIISGGLLRQSVDDVNAPGDDPSTWQLASGPAADAECLSDLAFAWRAARSVKSNGILLAIGGAALGIGMGQVNRVDSARLAVERAGSRAAGSVAASDAFFPFADGLQVLIDAGIRAVVQPGGSMRDHEVIAAAQAAGLTMYFTGTRHFFH